MHEAARVVKIYAIVEGTGRRLLVRSECDRAGCAATLAPGPDVAKSGWTVRGFRDRGHLYWFEYCPEHS